LKFKNYNVFLNIFDFDVIIYNFIAHNQIFIILIIYLITYFFILIIINFINLITFLTFKFLVKSHYNYFLIFKLIFKLTLFFNFIY